MPQSLWFRWEWDPSRFSARLASSNQLPLCESQCLASLGFHWELSLTYESTSWRGCVSNPRPLAPNAEALTTGPRRSNIAKAKNIHHIHMVAGIAANTCKLYSSLVIVHILISNWSLYKKTNKKKRYTKFYFTLKANTTTRIRSDDPLLLRRWP